MVIQQILAHRINQSEAKTKSGIWNQLVSRIKEQMVK